MKKMVVTVTDFDLLLSVINDACVEANERVAYAKKNATGREKGLEVLATALQKLRGEVKQAHQFR